MKHRRRLARRGLPAPLTDLAPALLALALLALLCLGPQAAAHDEPIPPPPGEPVARGFAACQDGLAAGYPCDNVDLLSFMPRSDLGFGPNVIANDIWGWTDPQDGTEYALVGTTAGTSFVRLRPATSPRLVGTLPTPFFQSTWRDIKTYGNYAFIGADSSPGHGIQIFDLRRLRGSDGPTTFGADRIYRGPGIGLSGGIQLASSHNVVINEESGFLYVVGSDTCRGGLHMVDISEPLRPRFRGCFDGDGYTHDAQCVIYRGPTTFLGGRELCFAANEDTVTLVDVTNKRDPVQLSRVSYPNVGYTHQVWVTEDHRFLLVNDELDEQRFGIHTRTLIFDITDPRAPRFAGAHEAETHATTHNVYVRGNRAYAANYAAGLRVLQITNPAQAQLREIASFDTRPGDDEPGFRGAWSSYPFFLDGKVIVSSIGEGLFVLRPFPTPPAPPAEEPPEPEPTAPADNDPPDPPPDPPPGDEPRDPLDVPFRPLDFALEAPDRH